MKEEKSVRFQQESPSAFPAKKCPFSARIRVRFAQELLSVFSRKVCPFSAGKCVRFGQEYAGSIAMEKKLFILCFLSFLCSYFMTAQEHCFVCQNNVVTGSHSSAFGYGNIVNGDFSFVAGSHSISSANNSLIIGNFLKTTKPNSIIIGSGIDEEERLINSIENSLVIGFNSTKPTLFVEPPPSGGQHLDFSLSQSLNGVESE